MTSQNRDYYEILGVSQEATFEEIRAAFRERAREYHPDRNPSADAAGRMRELNEAYEVLRDEEQRAAYDRMRYARSSSSSSGGGGSQFDSSRESERFPDENSWRWLIQSCFYISFLLLIVRSTPFAVDLWTLLWYILAAVLAVSAVVIFLRGWLKAQGSDKGYAASVFAGVLGGQSLLQYVDTLNHDLIPGLLVYAMPLLLGGLVLLGAWPAAKLLRTTVWVIPFSILILVSGFLLYEASFAEEEPVAEEDPATVPTNYLNTYRIGDCFTLEEPSALIPCDTPGAFRVEATRLYADSEGPLSSDEIRAHAELYCPQTTVLPIGPTEELWDLEYRLLMCLSGGPQTASGD